MKSGNVIPPAPLFFLKIAFGYLGSFVLIRFVPRYFVLFYAMVNEIVSLIYLSDSLLLMYRNVTDFYI